MPADNLRPVRQFQPLVSPPVLKQKACVGCRTRKVRCDRNSPCSNCTAWKVECVYPSPVRKCQRVRRRPAQTEGRNGAVACSQSIDTRLQRVEEVVQELTSLLLQHGPESTKSNKIMGRYQPSVMRLGVIENKLDQLIAMRDNIRTSISNPGLHVGTARYPASRLRPFNSFAVEVAPLHPPRNEALICWGTYLENIDQLVKVLHRPSTERILQKALAFGSCALSRGEEALLLAVYFSSVTSMSASHVETYFKTSKDALLLTYISVAEQALMRAEFLVSTDLVTLQAFGLFLSFNRFIDEGKFVWAMTGLARRLASTQGNVSPFEAEMCRRLSWKLWFLDQRAAEDRGRDPPSPPDPELPLNINDAELDSKMEALPASRHGWTEMSFSLIRYEIARTSSALEITNLTPIQKKSMINECTRGLRSKYLNHSDVSKPIHWLAQHSADVMTTELRIKLHSSTHVSLSPDPSPSSDPPSDQTDLIRTTLSILDAPRLVSQDPRAQHWKWLLSAYLQFQPLAFLLRELCSATSSFVTGTQGLDYEDAWRVVESAFARWTGESLRSGNGEVLVGLMERARGRMAEVEMEMVVQRQRQRQAALLMSQDFGQVWVPDLPREAEGYACYPPHGDMDIPNIPGFPGAPMTDFAPDPFLADDDDLFGPRL